MEFENTELSLGIKIKFFALRDRGSSLLQWLQKGHIVCLVSRIGKTMCGINRTVLSSKLNTTLSEGHEQYKRLLFSLSTIKLPNNLKDLKDPYYDFPISETFNS